MPTKEDSEDENVSSQNISKSRQNELRDRLMHELMTDFGIAQPIRLKPDLKITYFTVFDGIKEIGSFDVGTYKGNPSAGADVLDQPEYVSRFRSALERVDPNVSESGIIQSSRYYRLGARL